MIIGVPKEIKESEHRVGMTPSGVQTLIQNGHDVYVQNSAGQGSGHSDEDYLNVGASILKTIEEVYEISEMIIKVKEPLKKEYSLIKEGQIIYTYFHFASSLELTKAMIDSKSVCIAYETVENSDRSLPLLTPMSEVAGRMAAQQGAKFLEKHQKGCGILLGGVPGVSPAKAVVIGGGVVGTQSAKMLAGLGADVTILDINIYGDKKNINYHLYDEMDDVSKSSSMARTTGYTATATVNMLLNNLWSKKGVSPPEVVGANESCINFLFDYLSSRNVKISQI